jgi:hypothetical protein
MAKKDYVAGTGNVFEDLGSPRAAEALVKAELARKIGALIEQQRLTQAVSPFSQDSPAIPPSLTRTWREVTFRASF